MKYFLPVFLFILTVSAQAGTRAGNGGAGWLCEKESSSQADTEILQWIRFIDLYEATHTYGLTLNSYEGDETTIEIQVETRLNRVDPAFSQAISPYLTKLPGLKADPPTVIYTQNGLPLIDDAGNPTEPDIACDNYGVGAEYAQIVNYGDDGQIFVQSTLFAALTPTEQAALVFHEAIYAYLRDAKNETNSVRAQKLVGLLFSNFSDQDLFKNIESTLQNQVDPSTGIILLTIFETARDEVRRGNEASISAPIADRLKIFNDQIPNVNLQICTLPFEYGRAADVALNCIEKLPQKPMAVLSLSEDFTVLGDDVRLATAAVNLEGAFDSDDNSLADNVGQTETSTTDAAIMSGTTDTLDPKYPHIVPNALMRVGFTLPIFDVYCSEKIKNSSIGYQMNVTISAATDEYVGNNLAFLLSRKLRTLDIPYGLIGIPSDGDVRKISLRLADVIRDITSVMLNKSSVKHSLPDLGVNADRSFSDLGGGAYYPPGSIEQSGVNVSSDESGLLPDSDVARCQTILGTDLESDYQRLEQESGQWWAD